MPSAASQSPRRSKFTPLNVLLGGAVLIAICWFGIRIDTGHRNMATLSAIALVYVLYAIASFRHSSFSVRGRWSVLISMLAPLLVLRIDGCQGDLMPILSMRWQPQRDARLAKRVELDNQTVIDLTKTTPHDYPRFLGANGRATVTDVRLDPDWKQHPPHEEWRHAVGGGWSSFAVVGDFAVTQEQRGDDEAVVCYRLRSGEPVWMHTNPDRHDTALGGLGPRATPTIDRGIVFTLGALRWFNALDGATGKPLWTIDLAKEFNADLPDWARSGSPLVVGDLVVIGVGGDGQALMAFERLTGKLAWKAHSGRTSYATPVLARLGGVEQIVMLHQTSVTGHEPTTGRVLWTFDWPGIGMKVAQPIVLDERRVVVSSGYGYGAKLLDVTREGEQWQVKVVWESQQINPKFMNPIIVGEHLYGFDDGVAMTCLDLATGKRTWKRGRYGHGQMLQVGELFLIQAESGEVALVQPDSKEHRELARFTPLTDRTWNNPVIVGEYLLVRNDHEAACYRLRVLP